MRIQSVLTGLFLLTSAGLGVACGGGQAASSQETAGRAQPRASADLDAIGESDDLEAEAMLETPGELDDGSMDDGSSGAAAPEDAVARGAAGMEEMQPGGARAEDLASAGQERTSCPADLAELQVRVASAPRGAALVFSAADEDAEALRARLRLFSKIHEMQRLAQRAETSRVSKPADDPAALARRVPPPGPVQPKLEESPPEQRFADASALIHQASDVRVSEMPRGARLEIRFEDGLRLRDLREELRADADQLEAGNCPLAFSVDRG